jgi:hypothetical protein
MTAVDMESASAHTPKSAGLSSQPIPIWPSTAIARPSVVLANIQLAPDMALAVSPLSLATLDT